MTQLAELILPRTGSQAPSNKAHPQTSAKATDAGASDAGVAEFIDFMVFQDTGLQPMFKAGLAWMDAASSPQSFHALTHAQQTAILERIAYKKNFRAGDETGQHFFAAMRKYTVMGFYTSQIGLESLDYPGLRFYGSSPAVPQDGSLQRLGIS